MSRSRTRNLQALSTLVATSIASALYAACGQGSPSSVFDPHRESDASVAAKDSGGEGGGPDVGSGGCPPATTSTGAIDPTLCAPQVKLQIGVYGVCTATYLQPCEPDGGDAGDAGAADGCAVCHGFFSCDVMATDAGTLTTCGGGPGCCIGGRVPRGFRPRASPGGSPGGAWLALMAQAEAVSISAFRDLHADLARHRAPRRFLSATRVAERDEVRHARSVARAARRRGASVPRVTRTAPRPRSVEQLAIDNAGEGCVRETFGAAVAALQADRAHDPGVRRMLRTIAREELSHAALAWDLAPWLEGQLDAGTVARVAKARSEALDALDAEIPEDQPGDAGIGLPDGRTLRALLRGMRAALERGLPACSAPARC